MKTCLLEPSFRGGKVSPLDELERVSGSALNQLVGVAGFSFPSFPRRGVEESYPKRFQLINH